MLILLIEIALGLGLMVYIIVPLAFLVISLLLRAYSVLMIVLIGKVSEAWEEIKGIFKKD